MQLHVKSKQMAWCGIIMAITVILQIVSGIIETSSLFFLAAASFLTGCVERKYGVKLAAAFSAGAFILGLILAPEKLYCFTFLGFSIYVMVAEFFRKNTVYNSDFTKKHFKEYLIKGIIYHILLIIALVLSFKITGIDIIFSETLIENVEKMPVAVVAAAGIICAEIIWLVFDKAYIFFQNRYGLVVCGRED